MSSQAAAATPSQTPPNPFLAPAAEHVDRQQQLEPDTAIALLGRRKRLHTIELGLGIFGADMDREALATAIRAAQEAYRCLPGTLPSDLGHQVAIWRADTDHWAGGRWLFIEV